MCLTVCRGVGVSPCGSECSFECWGDSLWGWREVRGSGWPHMDPAMGFWGLHVGLTAVLGCWGGPIRIRLWGFGVTPYGSAYGVLG